ncbi:MAG: hypothetical protein QOK29_4465, partial [Rhodospirillaceae bacterium]|nr:hypothetical protein [Rhodospirillaceae bacterium]
MANPGSDRSQGMTRRRMLLAGGSVLATGGILTSAPAATMLSPMTTQIAAATSDKPNMVIIWGDDIGIT